MDLHTWITQQVDRVETTAKSATPGPWHVTEYNWQTDFDGGIGTRPGEVDIVGHGYEGGGVERLDDARHIAANGPAAVLRRCEADRRILARHAPDPDQAAFPGACKGCDLDSWGLPNTESVNDCPELLDLAHAHGITDDILAGLDRPTPPEPEPRDGRRLGLGDILATPPITTSDVPAALRGPNWKP